MAKNGLAHIAVDLPLFTTGQRQPQQRQRVEGVRRRHVQGGCLLPGQPLHLTVSPVTLALNFSGAQLAVVLQDAAKQHGLVVHAVAQPFQRPGQTLKGQVGIGRNKVQVKGDVLEAGHKRLSDRLAKIRRFAGMIGAHETLIKSSSGRQSLRNRLPDSALALRPCRAPTGDFVQRSVAAFATARSAVNLTHRDAR